ncbi:MAG: ketohydroxyglutarate aldolase [Nostocaceae cyanobacterium]|nr:ketohydroxyglutarate aldolase [Nostocaceae cyanobacterium]
MLVHNKPIPLLISIDDEHMDSFSGVVQKLQSAGLYTKQLMQQLGIITGECDPSNIDALRRVEGVSHVEREQSTQLVGIS